MAASPRVSELGHAQLEFEPGSLSLSLGVSPEGVTRSPRSCGGWGANSRLPGAPGYDLQSQSLDLSPNSLAAEPKLCAATFILLPCHPARGQEEENFK